LQMRSIDPSAKPEDFTALEMQHVRLSQRGFFRRAEAQYFRYRNGLLTMHGRQCATECGGTSKAPSGGQFGRTSGRDIYAWLRRLH
jgi:hypothetical protein